MTSAQPGWYPDPSGTPDRYRWWDGQSWTDAVGESANAQPPRGGEAPGSSTGRGRARRLLVVGLSFALFVTAGIGVGLVMWRDSTAVRAEQQPGKASAGAAGAGPTAAAGPTGQLRPSTRVANIGSASMTLPGRPYELYSDPMKLTGMLDVFFLANAPVHTRYNGTLDWSAMAGFGAVSPSLSSSTELEETGTAVLRQASARFFGGYPTTLRRVSAADQAVDGRPGVLVTAEVHYRIRHLASRFDRVTALLVRLDDGSLVVAITSVPNDAPSQLTTKAEQALESLTIG